MTDPDGPFAEGGGARSKARPKHGSDVGGCCGRHRLGLPDFEGPRVERFIRPCLLLLLHEKPAHGYELMDRLAEFGFSEEAQDPGAVYRHLRQMEEDGLVTSNWETSGSGPARRLYNLTSEGEELLHGWAVAIRNSRNRLDTFLKRYQTLFK